MQDRAAQTIPQTQQVSVEWHPVVETSYSRRGGGGAEIAHLDLNLPSHPLLQAYSELRNRGNSQGFRVHCFTRYHCGSIAL